MNVPYLEQIVIQTDFKYKKKLDQRLKKVHIFVDRPSPAATSFWFLPVYSSASNWSVSILALAHTFSSDTSAWRHVLRSFCSAVVYPSNRYQIQVGLSTDYDGTVRSLATTAVGWSALFDCLSLHSRDPLSVVLRQYLLLVIVNPKT